MRLGWENAVPKENARSIGGTSSGLYAEFEIKPGETVGLQVGISYLRLEKARRNLSVQRAVSFEQIRAAATQIW